MDGVVQPIIINNMCLYPKIVLNKKYIPNNKNGGIAPAVSDYRTLYISAGCGNCIECRKQISRNWQVRLHEEIKYYPECHMVTLTFSDESLIKLTNEIRETWNNIDDNDISTIAVRRFLERWRKKHKKSVKHWLVTELGHQNTERIHLHGLIWTDDLTEIPLIWNYGLVHIGSYVNQQTINYIVKYITKIDTDHKGYKAKILTSKGIGRNYINSINAKRNKYNGNNKTTEYYTTSQGRKINLPTYYRNKIYNDDEREKLWINKLDNGIIYIMGEPVKTDNDDELYKTLEYYQNKNKRLGYGDDSEEWSVKNYKNQRKKYLTKLSNEHKYALRRNTPKRGPK